MSAILMMIVTILTKFLIGLAITFVALIFISATLMPLFYEKEYDKYDKK